VSELLAGIVILLGIVGTVVPLLPGPVLVGIGVVGYAIAVGTTPAWVAAGIGVTVLVAGAVAKWWIPARTVSGDVDALPLIVGGILAVVGFFVIPVVGLVVGFVLGVLATELVRTRSWQLAWPATKTALKAAGLQMLIELASVVVAGSVWLAAMVLY